tara:strand:+ start:92 stop:256 length:165 start_codon:yes stop_codon:yes gene_type:complete
MNKNSKILVITQNNYDGASIKSLSNTAIKNLAWKQSYSFEDSLKIIYYWYIKNA